MCAWPNAVNGRGGVAAEGGTARVLAPLPSGGPYRAERPAFVWLVEREVLRFLKIWHFTIAGHVISALLFIVVFGFALDGRISGVQGIPYAQFILPGLAVQAVLRHYREAVLERQYVPGCELGAGGDAAPQLGWLSWSKTREMEYNPCDTILQL